MSNTPNFKRRARGRGGERPRYAEAHIAAEIAEWETVHEIAAELPHWEPGDPGRPPLFPPAMVLLFGVMRWGWGSHRSVERQLTHRDTWEPIRRAMYDRYPEYQGLRPGKSPMNRHQYHRYRNTYGIDDEIFERAIAAFRREAALLSLQMGMFDPNRFSLTHPDPTTMLAGDATVLKSRFDAASAQYTHPKTGEIITTLFDPDAASYPVFDEFGDLKSERVYGTKFGILQGRIPGCEHERVVVDIFHITTGDDGEQRSVVRAVERFQQLAPGLTGIVYDQALRGRHREDLYSIGLQTITKCPKVRKDVPRERHVGTFTARKNGQVVDKKVEVRAIGGLAHIGVPVAGKKEYVPLDRAQIKRAPVKGRKNGGRFRWTAEMRIPNDARVSPRLPGATIFIRLDDPDYRTAKYSRADSLHSIAPGDDDWARLFELRNPTESVNHWIKERLDGKKSRAPAVGARHNHFELMCSALYNNFAAMLAQADRLQRLAA